MNARTGAGLILMNVPDRVRFASERQRCVLHCLGRFKLQGASANAVPIRSRKARALLAVLAVAGPMSRDALADLLWSDRGAAQARGSLRQAVFEVQHLGGDADLLHVGRDDLAIRNDQLVTDIELIRDAAVAGDGVLLSAFLRDAGSGYLTDLDGIDGELDAWLRVQRAREPASTLSLATDIADNMIECGEHRTAMCLVEELLRLEPTDERAARAAMRIDHALGESAGVRRHYAALCAHLRDDYDVSPSRETVELYQQLTSNVVAEPAYAERPDDGMAPAPVILQPNAALRWPVAVGMVALLALAIAGFFLLLRPNPLSPPDSPVLVAVLQFEQQGKQDDFLAEGLWDDTRSALSRGGAVRVLGRATTAAAVGRKLLPDQFRRRFGVAYLLDGTVRQSGDRVRVAVSLTRTADGVGVWEDTFEARVGDPFAVQSAIANGIEGKLRGRLAPGGGHRPDQIATSPQVYALYSRARPLLRNRDRIGILRARALLRRAVALDPNFAPAWSSLAAAIYLCRGGLAGGAEQSRAARQAAVRALTLAPNLAEAQATLALIDGDNAAESESGMRRAVTLDPSYAEAWNWLGNSLASQARYSEAEQAYARAVALDPLWFIPAANMISVAHSAGDRRAVPRLLSTLARAGADNQLLLSLRAQERIVEADYSGAVRLLQQADWPRTTPSQYSAPLWMDVLVRLGEADAAVRRLGGAQWYGPLIRGERLPPRMAEGKKIAPADIWQDIELSEIASRAMVSLGHGGELVRTYRAAFQNADEFINRIGHGDQMVYLAPILAAALRQQGSASEADYLLAAAALTAENGARNAPRSAESAARLAYVRAAQGRNEDGLRQLDAAVSRGWLPDGRLQALDFAREPAFAALRSDPRLIMLRKRVLDHIARERAELGPSSF